MGYRVPVSTYRIQFNAGFTFGDARQIASYLSKLGISDLYASPILRPRKGSTHGYDIVDPMSLNPELGTDDDFAVMTGELQRLGMGLVVDIVPNHMAASHENAWWMSVLENGPQSRYLHYFDIDWRPVTTHDAVEEKVLLPILGKPYGECLESQELVLGFDADGFHLSYYDKRLPLAPQTYGMILREFVDDLPQEGIATEIRDLVSNESVIANSRFLKDTLWRMHEQSPDFRDHLEKALKRLNGRSGKQETFNALDAILDAQFYRLAYWRSAAETINYRRFFDVTDLVGVRIENPEVFELRNRRILDFIAEGKITGVRIDHIDGLHDPETYLRRLQLRLGDPASEVREQFYVVVEKILARDERMPQAFAVAGTTGYDFLDSVNAVFVDTAKLGALTEFYASFGNSDVEFEDLVYSRKKQVIGELFSGEMRALGLHLSRLATADRNARDFAPSDLLAALVEVTACMHIYRTYVREGSVSDADREAIQHALAEARRRSGGTVDERLFRFLELVLLLDVPPYIEGERSRWLAFVMRWQQFTGRVMAKGVEDTSFYNYNRLISMNEVGAEPLFPKGFDPVAALHERNERILRDWPNTMNTTSTHDTKRSEDVRARISVLSEIPDEWTRHVRRWSKANAGSRKANAPDRNEELMIYQTLLGVWPLDSSETDGVIERMGAFLEKAAREAKTNSSWLSPNGEYEQGLKDFTAAILRDESFRRSLLRLQKKVAFHGYLNSLAQVVLKIASPGVPDFYQGQELWDFSLVDPDNRRPVDYGRRQALLGELDGADAGALVRKWPDGRIKLFVTARALQTRAKHAET
ncbi:MAG: malto-oligosyltrehalose synthase, partial [Thermoanaerobaculia bacterium]